MPRPPLKRAKLNHPTPANRVAKPSKVSPVVELQQKLVNKPLGRVLTDSDDSDRLVTSNRSGRNRRGIPRKDIFASGGVGLGDVPGMHMSPGNQSQGSQEVGTPEARGNGIPAAVQQEERAARVAEPSVNRRTQVAERRNPPNHSSPSAPGSTATGQAPIHLKNTLVPETSILGTIKPRRRQPSILQLIENDNSSNIDDEDEDDFLPNDESTPLNHSAAQRATYTPSLSLSHSPKSRKRKLTTPITLVPGPQDRKNSPQLNHSQDANPADELDSERELPSPSRNAIGPLRVTPEAQDPDIMAPPLSSSPLQGPAQSALPSPVKKVPDKIRKQPLAPSTDELRALLPARRQLKGRRRHKSVSDFDIPADTDTDDSHASASSASVSDDDLSFRAETNGRKNKASRQSKAKPTKKRNNAWSRGIEQSTISPIKLVTPLKHSTRQKSAAKSSLSQQRGSAPKSARGKATYSSRRRDTCGNKENQPFDLSRDFSGGEERPKEESLEQSIEQPTIPVTKEMELMAKKFADVDEWEMEFEEVSLGGNSSPNRR